jgi:two-component system, response regulator
MASRQPILVVDDSADDVDLTLRPLKRAGVLNEVVVATDGVEALDYLAGTGKWAGRDAREIPAVVLLDLKMPRMDGLDVLSRVRSSPRTKTLPVVILTSSREEQDVVRGYDLGANSYVQKPVEFAEFAAAVSHLGVYWLLYNVPPAAKEG